MPKLTPRDAAVRIITRLRAKGHQALLAGGCVRDMLLGKTPKDYDVVTDARPERIVALFRQTRKVGAQFGVILVHMGSHWTEVATFRSDLSYEDGRHPSGVVFGSMEEDAERRDFTINGMFYDVETEQVVDCVGGRRDLEQGVIRAIGEPARRFAEDYLRLLRAVRFASRMGFDIEPDTRAAVIKHAEALRRTSAERVREELVVMLEDPQRAHAVALLHETGLLDQIWPDISFPASEAQQAQALLAGLVEPVSFETGLAGLLIAREPAEAGRLCRHLTCSNRERRHTVWLVSHIRRLLTGEPPVLSELKRMMAGGAFDDLRRLYRGRLVVLGRSPKPADELAGRAAQVPPEAVNPPPLLTGDDLIEMGYEPGPLFSRILERVTVAHLDEEISTREQAIRLAREIADPAAGGA